MPSPYTGDDRYRWHMADPPRIPENLEAFPPAVELGGAIGRRATVACQQGQHDLCTLEIDVMLHCDCRCHER